LAGEFHLSHRLSLGSAAYSVDVYPLFVVTSIGEVAGKDAMPVFVMAGVVSGPDMSIP
jgi:hypothetical protein